MFTKANWEPILFYPNRRVLPNLVKEFYSNMHVRHGAQNVVYITSLVSNKHITLDHVELGKALNLSSKMLDLANIDIYKEFVFNKSVLKLFLLVLCGLEVPQNLFETNTGVSYEHFTHSFQNLALIIRENILPNTSDDKLIFFVEIKLMYKLASHKITFNLPYMILMHMVSSFKKGFMSYGLLLTTVFEHFKINVNQQPNFEVTSTISDKAKRVIVPLPGFGEPLVVDLEANVILAPRVPNPTVPVPKFNFEKELAKLQEAHTKLEVMFKSLQEAFDKVVAKQEVTDAKVGVLVDILGNTVARAGRIEDGLSQMINVQLGLIDIPFLPLIEEMAEPLVRAHLLDDGVDLVE